MSSTPYLDASPAPPNIALVVGPDHTPAAMVATILPDWKIERACDNLAALAFIESPPSPTDIPAL
jgi:hypothetical protein